MGHPVHWMIIDKGTLVISRSLMTGQLNGSLIGLMSHLGQKMKDFIVQAGRAFGFIEMAGHGADYWLWVKYSLYLLHAFSEKQVQ